MPRRAGSQRALPNHQPKSLSNFGRTCSRFVGRSAELALFADVLDGRAVSSVLYVHGIGGIGKSALLREYVGLATERGLGVVFVDARVVDPSPVGFLVSLRDILGLDPAASPISHLAHSGRLVLLIDSYELLASIDDWMRESVIAPLVDRAVIVVAGRSAPDAAWRTDLRWHGRTCVIPLRNLTPYDSRLLLDARGVPVSQQASMLEFTRGHPLALALVGDVVAADPKVAFNPDRMPDVIHALLERIVAQAPSDDHRRTLELCAHVRVTTETLIRDLISETRAHELFEWLRRLSFIEHGPEGVLPHDVARGVLDADFRWRDPDAHAEMHRRVWVYLLARLRGTTGRAQQRVFFDKLYLHRFNPTGARYHDFGTLGSIFADPAAAEDHESIRALTRRHEGPASERIVAYWLQRQPRAFHVIRGVEGGLLGFVGVIAMHECSPEDRAADPGTAAALDYARGYAPARPGDELLHYRFYMSADEYQGISAATNLLALMVTTQAAVRPRLAWTFISLGAPDAYSEIMEYISFSRAPTADFAVGAKTYGTFAHDWRAQPFAQWWELEAGRSLSREAKPFPDHEPRPPAVLVSSESEFAAAVRRALRDFARPESLGANPLLRSRVVRQVSDAPTVADLQRVLREAVEQLNRVPRGEKFYKALLETYVQPVDSQERRAERRGLPFNTYRYHIARGTEHLIASLWRRELYGNE